RRVEPRVRRRPACVSLVGRLARWRAARGGALAATRRRLRQRRARRVRIGPRGVGDGVMTSLDSPYRGLASFGDTAVDPSLFFGRERETEIVTASLLASRLTVLYGPSGAGKSSLLRAGVAHRVREPDLACVVFSSWSSDPVRALADAIGDAVRPLVSPTAL